MNNIAYIDGQNLIYGTTHSVNPWNIDLKRFRVYLHDKYHINEAYYFIGSYDAKHQELYNQIQKSGYILIFREHSDSAISKKKGNVDTDIVFMIMKELIENDSFDKIVLVSGDGDYWRMVDYLIKKEKFEKLLAPSQKGMSSLYRRISDNYRSFLDQKEIRNKIERK